jgi:hypothetical protein
MAKKKAKAKRKAEVKAISIYCPNKKRIVSVPLVNLSWNAHADECEICGTHGDVSVDVSCPCGKSHEIELSSW